MKKNRVVGYVKLAKLWEKRRSQALTYHNRYYREKYNESDDFELIGVFVDITGQKSITKRTEMIKVIAMAMRGEIDVVSVQTSAYIAANMEELCFWLYLILTLEHRVDVITDDEKLKMDTFHNSDNERKELIEMSENYIQMSGDRFKIWKIKIQEAIEEKGY